PWLSRMPRPVEEARLGVAPGGRTAIVMHFKERGLGAACGLAGRKLLAAKLAQRPPAIGVAIQDEYIRIPPETSKPGISARRYCSTVATLAESTSRGAPRCCQSS